MIQGLLSVADMCDLVAALAPKPVFMEALVDGCNRRASRQQVAEIFRIARMAYDTAGQPERLQINVEPAAVVRTATWLLATACR